jgi:hypothetical protein
MNVLQYVGLDPHHHKPDDWLFRINLRLGLLSTCEALSKNATHQVSTIDSL